MSTTPGSPTPVIINPEIEMSIDTSTPATLWDKWGELVTGLSRDQVDFEPDHHNWFWRSHDGSRWGYVKTHQITEFENFDQGHAVLVEY